MNHSPPPPRAPRGPRGLLVGTATGVTLVAVLVGSLAVRSHIGSSPSSANTVVPAASASSDATPGGSPATATPQTVTPAGSASAVVVPPPTAPGPVQTPRATPARTAPSAGTVTLSDSSDGTSITVHAGTTIVVDLAASSSYRWTEPDTSNAGVVRRSSGSTGADGSATATFDAVSPGSADLSAVDNPDCLPQGCRPPSRLWRVTVTVVP